MDRTEHLEEIFSAAVKRVDPYEMIRSQLSLNSDTLRIAGEREDFTVDLRAFSRLIVIGAGKASAVMARGLTEILGSRISEAIVVVKYGHAVEVDGVEVVEAAHPVPDENGVEAGRRILELVRSADRDTLVVSLLSGGGSALFVAPYSDEQHSITLEDLITTNDVLLASGAPIQSVNCIRKHISQAKGGKLAREIHPAASVNIILSDVVGDSLDTIASGLTAPDPTTYADCLAIVRRYGIEEQLPSRVVELLRKGAAGDSPETVKPGDVAFSRCRNVLLGTNYAALGAARRKAEALGYRTVVLSSQITGEAKEIAKVYSGIAKDQVERGVHGPGSICVIGGGETTVTIRGGGLGGRCQELALSYLVEVDGSDAADRAWFLSASTDGSDGPTDAAGAFVCPETVGRRTGEAAVAALDRNDSYTYFDSLGALLRTGPTKTNVCDIQLLIVETTR